MSGIMKVFLLLAVMFCISKAQLDHTSGNQCWCTKVQKGIQSGTNMKDLDIKTYLPTAFCDKKEIVVTNKNNGRRYCLNPELKSVQRLIARMNKRAASDTTRPTNTTSSSSTAHI